MKPEDAEAIFNLSYPNKYLEVKDDHLILTKLTRWGRFIRWLGFGYENTRIDVVAAYIAKNYEEWVQYPTDKQPCTIIYKYLKTVNRKHPNKFSTSFEKIKLLYKEKIKKDLTRSQIQAWSPAKRDLSQMTDEQIRKNMHNLTIEELVGLPIHTTYRILFIILKGE